MAVRIENQAEPIPGYRLLERIGGGGFGEVWKCEAPGGLHKAIKFVFGDLGAAGDDGHRAEQELKALSRVKTVRHPYILSLERYDIIDGQLIIVMELADHNLWDRYKEYRASSLPGIPREELLRYMEETAEALDLMNEQYQLQHLDIKPQNLFLVHNHVKVADFGLVKDLQGMQASVTGGVTPVYASPETFDGYVSRYSDQYSLAIVYQELLTGKRPFAGANVRQLIMQHLQAVPNLEPLPPGDQPVIARALAKSPDERHPSCRSLVALLREATDIPLRGPSSPPTALPSPPRPLTPDTEKDASDVSTQVNGLRPQRSEGGDPKSESEESRAKVGSPRSEFRSDRSPISDLRPLPSEVDRPLTPRPDSHPGTTKVIRILEDSGRAVAPGDEAAPASLRPAPPEVHGDGVLFPALVIGLGQMGFQVLQQTRQALAEAAPPGASTAAPHLRFLLLDTDAEVCRQAAVSTGSSAEGRPRPATVWTPAEVLLLPLNRPSYYLKNREGRMPLDIWLPPRMLYRIPRSQVTTGVRALGRLAWCDNYRFLLPRLRAELEALFDPEPLTAAARQTGLGLRTNRPRVCIVTSLAGGTGSGMFLDLAYTVRALLRQAGCQHPDVTGLFLLPAVDGNRTRALALGNAYAALTELNHFARPDTCFRAQYSDRETIHDMAPPFSRCTVLSLPEETDEAASRAVVSLAGQYLYRDLFTPLGRTADLARVGLSSSLPPARSLSVQTFGLFRLSWPRRALFLAVGRRLCQQLITRWMSKDSKPVREAVKMRLQEQWVQHELGADVFLDRLAQTCGRKMGQSPETALQAVLQPLLDLCAPGTQQRSEVRGQKSEMRGDRSLTSDLRPLTSEEIASALGGFADLLGDPTDDGPPEPGPRLVDLLHEASDKLVQEWGQKLSELTVHLIEEPDFRLAGAEEAVRQAVATIEQALQHHEPLLKDLTARAREAHGRLKLLATPPHAGASKSQRRPPDPADVLELLRRYAKWRYQSLVLEQMAAAFVTLRGQLADEMREINFCRVRLAELHRLLADPGDPEPARPPGGDRCIFPTGCPGMEDAVREFLAGIGPEALRELDVRVEAMLRQRFIALVNVCLSRANVLKDVEAALLEIAEAFAADHQSERNVAEMFLEQHPDAQAEEEVANCFDKAAPAIRRPRGTPEVCVLTAPPGPSGDHFRELVRQAAPGGELYAVPTDVSTGDEIVLYRELTSLSLTDLEQLGPVGREAYARMTSAENYTPHSRTDIQFTPPDAG